MSDSRTAGGLDRLPWLSDEPHRPATVAKKRDLLPWAIAIVVLVAALSFWFGTRVPVSEIPQGSPAPRAIPRAPQLQPAPIKQVEIAPQPQVRSVEVPQVRQAPVAQVRIAPPRRIAPDRQSKPAISPSEDERATARAAEKTAPKTAPARKAAQPAVLTPWPPRVTAGAYGRLVQIGAYGSRLQAKQGWVKMVRAYPAVAHLPALVVETRNSRRRAFYRFQIGTTSQAHSEVLCQRMQKIGLSCAIIGLPWKAKVER